MIEFMLGVVIGFFLGAGFIITLLRCNHDK